MATYDIYHNGKYYDDIYYDGHWIDQVYIGKELVWEKIRHPMYSQYFMVNAMKSAYGDHLIDEYGVRLDVNEDAVVEKCAVYLQQLGSKWERTIACTGRNIIYARYVPYLAYRGEIIYDGLTTSIINTYSLSQYSSGIWNYKNYSMMTANLAGADGKDLTVHSIGVGGMNTRIFYDLSEMKAWLRS